MRKVTTSTTVQVYQELWKGIKPYKWSFYFALASFTLSSIIGIFIPRLYKRFFDLLTQSQNKVASGPALIRILIYIAALNAVTWLLYRLATFVSNKLSAQVMARLRQNSFDYMIGHSYTFFSNNFTGSLVQRINRFSRAFDRLSDSLVYNVIPLTVTIIGSVVVVWFIVPLFSVIIMAWVVVFTAFNFLFSQWKLKYDVKVAEADSKTTGYLSDDITNQNAVALFTGTGYESMLFREVTEAQSKITRFAWDLGSIVDAVQLALIFIIEFVVFYYGVKYWQRGLITVGTFVLIQAYIIGLANQLWGFGRILRNIYEGIADSKEMVDILRLPHEIKDVEGAKELAVANGKVEFKDVTFAFNATRNVLDHINLHISGGEKVALIGPSGAGKSTFVRLLLRLYDTGDGLIEVDGQDIKKVTQESLRGQMSLVPQDPVLFHRSLMENIRYGKRDATDAEVIAAAKLAHCDEFVKDLPDGYETFVGERGIKLSGGERQRVAIARAILKNAPILILDEATSSLDSHSESLIADALAKLMAGKTTIVIAHRLSTIRKMDRIIVIDGGKIIEEGTHQSLLAQDGSLYQKLWNLQAGGFLVE